MFNWVEWWSIIYSCSDWGCDVIPIRTVQIFLSTCWIASMSAADCLTPISKTRRGWWISRSWKEVWRPASYAAHGIRKANSNWDVPLFAQEKLNTRSAQTMGAGGGVSGSLNNSYWSHTVQGANALRWGSSFAGDWSTSQVIALILFFFSLGNG